MNKVTRAFALIGLAICFCPAFGFADGPRHTIQVRCRSDVSGTIDATVAARIQENPATISFSGPVGKLAPSNVPVSLYLSAGIGNAGYGLEHMDIGFGQGNTSEYSSVSNITFSHKYGFSIFHNSPAHGTIQCLIKVNTKD